MFRLQGFVAQDVLHLLSSQAMIQWLNQDKILKIPRPLVRPLDFIYVIFLARTGLMGLFPVEYPAVRPGHYHLHLLSSKAHHMF